MKLRVVPPGFVAQVWPTVAPMLAPVIEYACGDYELEHLRVYITTGQWMLVVIEDGPEIKGAITVEFVNRATKRVAFVTAMGGKVVTNESNLSQLKGILKSFGATHIEAGARESVYRLFRRLGFEEKCKMVELEIKP